MISEIFIPIQKSTVSKLVFLPRPLVRLRRTPVPLLKPKNSNLFKTMIEYNTTEDNIIRNIRNLLD